MLQKSILLCYYSILFYKYISFIPKWHNKFLFKINRLYVLILNSCFILYNKFNIFFYFLYRGFFYNLKIINLKLSFLKIINKYKYCFFKKYFVIGLGYEVFIYKNYFFLNFGLSHYSKIKLLPSIRVYCKKKRFYIISFCKIDFIKFLAAIKRLSIFNIYKVKGLMWFKSVKYIKGRIGLKQGKKKYR